MSNPRPNPTDQIVQYRSQNMSNNQIVQNLQQQGYTQHEIFEALNMADMKQNFTGPEQMPNMAQPQNPMGMQPKSIMGAQGGLPPQGPPGMAPPQNMPPPAGNPAESGDDVEELIEAVIEEKWGELKKTVDKIILWKEKTETKISHLEQSFDDLKDDFSKLQQAVVGKVGEYDKNILEVGTELKAMEKVFSKVLPTFTENVNELNRITEKFKQQ